MYRTQVAGFGVAMRDHRGKHFTRHHAPTQPAVYGHYPSTQAGDPRWQQEGTRYCSEERQGKEAI